MLARHETSAEPVPPSGGPGSALIRDLVVVAIATTVANLSSYLLSIAAARVLPPAEFGAFAALLGLSIIGSTAAIAAQAVTARRVAVAAPADRGAVAEGALRATLTAAWVLAALGVVLAWPVAEAIDTSPLAVAAAVGSVAVLVFGFAVLGTAQGHDDNVRFGSDYAFLNIVRAGAAVLAVVVEPTALSACVGMLAGALIGTAIVAMRRPHRTRPRAAVPGTGRELWRNVVSVVALYALINLDVVLARAFLDEDTSARYAVGSLVAKIAFFLPLFVSLVLFPRMARATDRRHHAVAIGATVGLGAAGTLVTFLFAETIVRVVAGAEYLGVVPWLWVFAAQGGVYAVVQATLYSRLSEQDRGVASLLWVACVGFVVVVAVWTHGSLENILCTSLAVGVVLMLAGISTELRSRPQTPSAA